jgi:hypothetical protein
MPCIKCSNGKWKYGERGNCQFDTLAACKAAAAAIHIHEPGPHGPVAETSKQTVAKLSWHDDSCTCASCTKSV